MAIVNTALTLQDLPAPPEGKIGWPWTEQSEPLPDKMPDGSEWSRISIVTPSYNQGQFIEETIRSVLLQGYPNLEYIIIDGGSTDNSVEIIKRYEPYLAYWVSKRDRGQSHALNQGFQITTGEWIGWQNSDDYYCKDAFKTLIQAYLSDEISDSPSFLYTGFNMVEVDGRIIKSIEEEFDYEKMLPYPCISNQGMLIRSVVFKDSNFLDESLHYMMDYEFFWRLFTKGYTFKFVPAIGGCFRRHSQGKTISLHPVAAKEFFEFYKKLYQDNSLSLRVRKKVLSCMVGSCLNDFGCLRLKIFREHFRDVISLSGLTSLTFELILKYLISFFDERIILFLKNAKIQYFVVINSFN